MLQPFILCSALICSLEFLTLKKKSTRIKMIERLLWFWFGISLKPTIKRLTTTFDSIEQWWNPWHLSFFSFLLRGESHAKGQKLWNGGDVTFPLHYKPLHFFFLLNHKELICSLYPRLPCDWLREHRIQETMATFSWNHKPKLNPFLCPQPWPLIFYYSNRQVTKTPVSPGFRKRSAFILGSLGGNIK